MELPEAPELLAFADDPGAADDDDDEDEDDDDEEGEEEDELPMGPARASIAVTCSIVGWAQSLQKKDMPHRHQGPTS